DPTTRPANETKQASRAATNETRPVAGAIYQGPTTSGSEVTSISATPAGGRWKTPQLSRPLEEGEYTAVARQGSGIGNGPGESQSTTFSIRTKPPEVTLNAF